MLCNRPPEDRSPGDVVVGNCLYCGTDRCYVKSGNWNNRSIVSQRLTKDNAIQSGTAFWGELAVEDKDMPLVVWTAGSRRRLLIANKLLKNGFLWEDIFGASYVSAIVFIWISTVDDNTFFDEILVVSLQDLRQYVNWYRLQVLMSALN